MTCHNLIVRKRASATCEYHSSSEESVESEESQEPEIQAEKAMSCSEASAQSGSDDSSDEEKIYFTYNKAHESDCDSESDDIINNTDDDDSFAVAVKVMRAECDAMMDKIDSTLAVTNIKNSTSRSDDDGVHNLYWNSTSR